LFSDHNVQTSKAVGTTRRRKNGENFNCRCLESPFTKISQCSNLIKLFKLLGRKEEKLEQKEEKAEKFLICLESPYTKIFRFPFKDMQVMFFSLLILNFGGSLKC
jgi:hypothetical protein